MAIFVYKQGAPAELKAMDRATPAESPVYRPDKSKIQAPGEPPFDCTFLKAISLY